MWEFRFPRTLAAALVGAMMALSGAALQNATRNGLADPSLVGVSQGAALAVVTLTVIFPEVSSTWRPWAAFAGAILVAVAVQGLGVRTGRLKVQLLAVVVVLTACAVALAGPLGFIGLVIPHVVRLYVGSDYRWIVPYAALTGAVYLLGVDIIARIAIPPREISTGIITAMVGAPLFVHLVRQRAR